jgi:hypothetical protein
MIQRPGSFSLFYTGYKHTLSTIVNNVGKVRKMKPMYVFTHGLAIVWRVYTKRISVFPRKMPGIVIIQFLNELFFISVNSKVTK